MAKIPQPPQLAQPASPIGAGLEDRLAAIMPKAAAHWLNATDALAEDLQLVYQQGQVLVTESRRRWWHAHLLDEHLAGRVWSEGLLAAATALSDGFEQGVYTTYLSAAAGYSQVGSALLRALSSPTGTPAATIDLAKIERLARHGARVTLVKSEVLKPPKRHPSWNDSTTNFMLKEHNHLRAELRTPMAIAEERGLRSLVELPAQGEELAGHLADKAFMRYGETCTNAIFNLLPP